MEQVQVLALVPVLDVPHEHFLALMQDFECEQVLVSLP